MTKKNKTKKNKSVKEKLIEKPAEDRSAYNCLACGGEGLKDSYTICPECKGTGKV